MLRTDLEQLGLTSNEARAYIALLELGWSTMSHWAKKSSIKRTTLYDILDSLKRRGLVSMTKEKKRIMYVAEDPRVIVERLEEQKKHIENILPELLSIANNLERKPKIRFYEGVDGVKMIYKDTLRYKKQEIIAWVPEEIETLFDETFLEKYYHPQRIERKIWARVIAPDEPYMKQYQSRDAQVLRKTRLVPAGEFPLDVEIALYGERNIGIMSFSDKMGLIIESKSIFTTLKSIFELQWKSLEK